MALLDNFVLVGCWPQGDKMNENLALEQINETLNLAENRIKFPHSDGIEAASNSNGSMSHS